METFLAFCYQYQLHYVFRVLLAAICGFVIGFERKNRAKEAGIRTHCIVACAAALMMIISKYGFFDMIMSGSYPAADVRLDPSRMAQGIVTGVGFLGAGMIFVHKNTIKGLTTAAGIWATSGIGMALGAGMYFIGIFSTLLILFIQITFHMNTKIIAMPKNKCMKLYYITEENFQDKAKNLLHNKKVIINEISVESNEDGSKNYTYDIEIPASTNEEDLLSMFNCKGYIETMR